ERFLYYMHHGAFQLVIMIVLNVKYLPMVLLVRHWVEQEEHLVTPRWELGASTLATYATVLYAAFVYQLENVSPS
ncbi:hypothetical protein L9F63_024308, partial [Diploptera punctata]